MKENINNIVLNIPHSSKIMPINNWEGDIDKEIEKWTDIYTDIIFNPHKNYVTPVICPFSRFFCDVERLYEDPLEKIGQGFAYTRFNDCKRNVSRIRSTIHDAWLFYRNLLRWTLNKNSLLIDCHSFPEEVAPDIDICIGYNEDWSKPSKELIDLIVDYFKHNGYNVGINNPYGNSISPHREFYYPSIMIELNKKIYLDDKGELKPETDKLSQHLGYLYDMILEDSFEKTYGKRLPFGEYPLI